MGWIVVSYFPYSNIFILAPTTVIEVRSMGSPSLQQVIVEP